MGTFYDDIFDYDFSSLVDTPFLPNFDTGAGPSLHSNVDSPHFGPALDEGFPPLTLVVPSGNLPLTTDFVNTAIPAAQPQTVLPTVILEESTSAEAANAPASSEHSHPVRVRRATNAWITYRAFRQKVVENTLGKKLDFAGAMELSRTEGLVWRTMPKEERRPWQEKADEETRRKRGFENVQPAAGEGVTVRLEQPRQGARPKARKEPRDKAPQKGKLIERCERKTAKLSTEGSAGAGEPAKMRRKSQMSDTGAGPSTARSPKQKVSSCLRLPFTVRSRHSRQLGVGLQSQIQDVRLRYSLNIPSGRSLYVGSPTEVDGCLSQLDDTPDLGGFDFPEYLAQGYPNTASASSWDSILPASLGYADISSATSVFGHWSLGNLSPAVHDQHSPNADAEEAHLPFPLPHEPLSAMPSPSPLQVDNRGLHDEERVARCRSSYSELAHALG